jgi:nucleotide-binding universal stress UspA family protein
MYQRLLVPVDGSELSARAMQKSIELARQLGAAITGFVAEPVGPSPMPGADGEAHEAVVSVHEERAAEHARRVLRQFELQAREAGVEFSGEFSHAHNVDVAIAHAADEHRCDMIVMVTHGRGSFGQLLFGSHTKAVMQRSRLPLLVLH